MVQEVQAVQGFRRCKRTSQEGCVNNAILKYWKVKTNTVTAKQSTVHVAFVAPL